MKPVLVTGATGFVGRAVCRSLIDRGYPVLACIRSTDHSAGGKSPQIVSIRDIGDMTAHDWEPIVSGVDTVIHLAARVHVMRETAADPLLEFRRVNVEGTRRLAEAAATGGVRRFIYVSSIKVSGEATTGRPFRASDPANPQDAYGQSKHEAEQVLREMAVKSALEPVVVRPPLVYGPGVCGNFEQLMRWARSGLPLPLGAIQNRRSLVSVYNLVDLLGLCVDHPAAVGETLLVSDGEDLSTTELLRRVSAAFERPARLLPVPPTLLAAGAALLGGGAVAQRLLSSLQVDISRTCDLLGWRPPVSVDESLRRTARDILATER